MAKITNLNRFRKAKARADKTRQAEENRVRFGRTRAEKTLSEANRAKLHSHLDGHRLDRDDE